MDPDVPYRQMPDVLGADEREAEATRKLGQWRDRTRTTWLAIFAVVGLVPAAVGYWLVQELQFRVNGVAFVRINVLLGVAIPWLAFMFLGRLVGTRIIRTRMDAQVTRLAAAYEIPRDRLAETAQLLAGI